MSVWKDNELYIDATVQETDALMESVARSCGSIINFCEDGWHSHPVAQSTIVRITVDADSNNELSFFGKYRFQ